MTEKFNYVKKGYNPTEVDTYIETIETVLTSYKEKDAAIKNALINAQIAADNIVKNAELEADKIISKTMRQLEDISNSIDDQKRFIKEFQEDYNAVINRYVHQFNDAEILKLYNKISELEDYVVRLKNSAPETGNS